MLYINLLITYADNTQERICVKHFYYSDGKIYFFETDDNDFYLSCDEINAIEIE